MVRHQLSVKPSPHSATASAASAASAASRNAAAAAAASVSRYRLSCLCVGLLFVLGGFWILARRTYRRPHGFLALFLLGAVCLLMWGIGGGAAFRALDLTELSPGGLT